MDNSISTIKLEVSDDNPNDSLEVEFEILPVVDISETDEKRKYIYSQIQDLDGRINATQNRIDELNAEIDKLTNHADGLDYMVAVASGVLTGLLDVFLVGEINLKEAHDFGEGKIDSFVKGTAKLNSNANGFVNKLAVFFGFKKLPTCSDSENLEKAVSFLEKNFPFVGDKVTNAFGGGLQHHLRDFAHHPSILGLFCSLFTQFSGLAIGTDTLGKLMIEKVEPTDLIGKNPLEKIFLGTVRWFLHLVSDMAGSSGSIARGSMGTGIPGPIVSLAKDLSVIPPFCNMKCGDNAIPVYVSKIFNGTFFAEHDANGKIIKDSVVQVDLRTEIGVFKQQYWPVLINECIVRTFYAIRRFVCEWKEKKVRSLADFIHLDWKKIKPLNNRTIARMMTISTGTFTAVDLCGASISSGAKNGFNVYNPLFWKDLILSVNFVGIGRFAIAIGNDVYMGVKKNKKDAELRLELTKQLYLKESKLFYKTADVWIGMEEVEETVNKVVEHTEKAVLMCNRMLVEDMKSLMVMQGCLPTAIERNPEIKDMIDVIF